MKVGLLGLYERLKVRNKTFFSNEINPKLLSKKRYFE
jgi:hypothetical protein